MYQPRLVLPGCVLRLAEGEPAVPPHALHCAHFLDRLLEPQAEECVRSLVKVERPKRRIRNSQPDLRAREGRIALAEHVELGVAIEDAGRYELVEDTDDERGKEGEEDVAKRERPGLVGNLPREVVKE